MARKKIVAGNWKNEHDSKPGCKVSRRVKAISSI